jgi:hypothetical protein
MGVQDRGQQLVPPNSGARARPPRLTETPRRSTTRDSGEAGTDHHAPAPRLPSEADGSILSSAVTLRVYAPRTWERRGVSLYPESGCLGKLRWRWCLVPYAAIYNYYGMAAVNQRHLKCYASVINLLLLALLAFPSWIIIT